MVTGLVAVSLLLSAWSNVIAACFCPRYNINHDHARTHLSHMPIQDESSCNHEMSTMKMDDQSSGVQRQDSVEHAVFESSDQRCKHCLMFSASTSATATLVSINLGNRLLETDAALVSSEIALTSSFSITIDPSEHGPPGNLVPRHILISIFRI